MTTQLDPFPLPLAPFEHYMLADDLPDHPMTVFVRLVFSGTLDARRFRSAIAQALISHPLLRARVKGNLSGRTRDLEWVANVAESSVAIPHANGSSRCHSRFDLLSEPGLEIEIHERLEQPCVIISWHHSCCDGAGMFHFLESVLLAYRDHGETSPAQPALVRDQAWWQARSHLNIPWYRNLARLPCHVGRILKYSYTTTVPLAPDVPVADPGNVSADEEFCSLTFTPEESSALLKVAQQNKVTLNDLLLRDYFCVLHDWNKRQGVDMRGKKLRLAVPINLRHSKAVVDPAINLVSMVFLDRAAEQTQDPAALLQGIHREMHTIKHWRTGWALLNVLRIAGWFRGGVVRLLRAGAPKVGACLSNFGIIFQSPSLANQSGQVCLESLQLERIEPFPPVRPGVLNAVGVATYGGRLTVTMNRNRTILSGEGARQLLDLFGAQLLRTLRTA